jgi:hypothetical protein
MGSSISIPEFLKTKNWEKDSLQYVSMLIHLGLCADSIGTKPCDEWRYMSILGLILDYNATVKYALENFAGLGNIINPLLSETERVMIGNTRHIASDLKVSILAPKLGDVDLELWVKSPFKNFTCQVTLTGHSTSLFITKHVVSGRLKYMLSYHDSGFTKKYSSDTSEALLESVSKSLAGLVGTESIVVLKPQNKEYVRQLQLTQDTCATWSLLIPWVLAVNPQYVEDPYYVYNHLVKHSRQAVLVLFCIFYLTHYLIPKYGESELSKILFSVYPSVDTARYSGIRGQTDMGCELHSDQASCSENCEWIQLPDWQEGRCIFKEKSSLFRLGLGPVKQIEHLLHKISMVTHATPIDISTLGKYEPKQVPCNHCCNHFNHFKSNCPEKNKRHLLMDESIRRVYLDKLYKHETSKEMYETCKTYNCQDVDDELFKKYEIKLNRFIRQYVQNSLDDYFRHTAKKVTRLYGSFKRQMEFFSKQVIECEDAFAAISIAAVNSATHEEVQDLKENSQVQDNELQQKIRDVLASIKLIKDYISKRTGENVRTFLQKSNDKAKTNFLKKLSKLPKSRQIEGTIDALRMCWHPTYLPKLIEFKGPIILHELMRISDELVSDELGKIETRKLERATYFKVKKRRTCSFPFFS